jgi:hypothetical protein
MSAFARSKVSRVMTTILSYGAQDASPGRLPCSSSVLSAPITANRPSASSKISGQDMSVELPLSRGEAPSLRIICTHATFHEMQSRCQNPFG